MSRLVLGINSAHGDSSAVLVGDGGVLAAIAEERINRKKHCGGFPKLAVREVLRIAGASVNDVTDIAVARDPRANLAAKLAFVARYPAANAPRALSRLRIHRKVASSHELVADALGAGADQVRAKFHQVEHHLAHVASSFFTSPYERAAGFSCDNTGDFATSMTASCEGTRIDVRGKQLWPHSLGVFYTAVCQYIGFDRFGEEYKVMGLSAYGVNSFAREMRQLVWADPERGLVLDLEYFRHHKITEGLIEGEGGEVLVPQLWGERMTSLFGPPRRAGTPLTDRDRDLAASLQFRFEDVYLALVARAVERAGVRDIVMAGGSVLNSVGNGRMITERVVDRAYFHPAAADDGTAAGAALYVHHAVNGRPRAPALRHAYLGTEWSEAEIEQAVIASGLPFKRLARQDLIDTAADTIAKGKIIGWFQGREEWGPRALGNRSILCHPGWPGMKATLNARIKNREPFRPFAPAVRIEKLSTCFQGTHEVPFMIIVYKVRPEWRERLAAVTHEDGTGRVQSVRRDENPMYYDLIAAFEKRTDIPVLLNTSFNENEPIVHTPKQAIDCFSRTRMDALGVGPFWLEKPEA
ncbi:Nodulation protein nolO [Minicystis rosea]|nr:Nodulation protein nolO [Minicystis rosea]